MGWGHDVTSNPVVGCTKCSPGCEHCYAERFARRMPRNPQTWQKYAGVVDANGKWTGKVNVALDAKTMPHRVPGKNKRVFVGSMSDLFHPNVSDATRDAIFASILGDHIIGTSRRHTFMILTKRAEAMCDYFTLTSPDELLRRWGRAGDNYLFLEGDISFSEYLEGHLSYYGWETFWPLPNLWVGVTVCNQEEADSKTRSLLYTPAARRFLSVEPMLGPVSFNMLLSWVICGGETGPGARPMHPDWVRRLRDQCVATRTPFYFKGWGQWMLADNNFASSRILTWDKGQFWDNSDAQRPCGEVNMVYCYSRPKHYHLLDGKEWREFPVQEVSR